MCLITYVLLALTWLLEQTKKKIELNRSEVTMFVIYMDVDIRESPPPPPTSGILIACILKAL
jgi:hypothetical protein